MTTLDECPPPDATRPLCREPPPLGSEGERLAFRAVSPDGKAYTSWYYDTHSAIFYALTGHIGNGHWKKHETD
jgi:hypothetical protein